MAEKTGRTGKLINDFILHAILEVQIKGTWYRVTSSHFRSFDGNRQVTLPDRQPKQGEYEAFFVGGTLTLITETYDGPVFIEGTNRIVPRMNTETIISNPDIKPVGNPVELNSARA